MAVEEEEKDVDRVWREALAAIDRGEVTPELERAVVEAARRVKRRQKLRRRHAAQETRDELRAKTGRVVSSSSPLPGDLPGDAASSPRSSPGDLPNHAHCYVCKKAFKTLHPFYASLCVPCGDANFGKRVPSLRGIEGRRAIITGGRTKIGYRAALMLLRGGATVTITTRYPSDAARRFASEEDYGSFRDRLRIEGIDFRDIRAAHAFLDAELARREPLDFLINLAAQTIRSSPALEEAERERDQRTRLLLTSGEAISWRGAMVEDPMAALVADKGAPLVKDPDHGEWVDKNAKNTWDLPLEDISMAEFFEVQLVNVFAPWAFTARLQPLFVASRFEDRYVVQVSAIEGQFDGPEKSGKHPHTNMAKAALHMLVRTSAEPLARNHGIYMNAVDPGWVSDQSAILKRSSSRPPFVPPLDGIDGAARVLDPIVRGIRGDRVFGLFLKNYDVAPW